MARCSKCHGKGFIVSRVSRDPAFGVEKIDGYRNTTAPCDCEGATKKYSDHVKASHAGLTRRERNAAVIEQMKARKAYTDYVHDTPPTLRIVRSENGSTYF